MDPLPKAILSYDKFENIGLLALIEPGELRVLISFLSLF